MAEAEARARALPLVLNMMEVAESKMTDAGNKAATNLAWNLAMILAQNKAEEGSSFDLAQNKAEAGSSFNKMADDEKAKLAAGTIRIEILPDAIVEKLKKRPFKRPRSRSKRLLEDPELAEVITKLDAQTNWLVDLQEDVVKQAEEYGCAKVGVEVMECGRENMFRLPKGFFQAEGNQ